MIISPVQGTQGPGTSAQRSAAPAQQPPADSPAQAAAPQTLHQAVASVNHSIASLGSGVQFQIDSQTGKAIVRVVDTETGQVIRQIPSEEMLELRHALDRIAGRVVDETA